MVFYVEYLPEYEGQFEELVFMVFAEDVYYNVSASDFVQVVCYVP